MAALGSDRNFPVLIKPAKMCSRMFINENSITHDQHELDQHNENLPVGQKGNTNSHSNSHCNGTGKAIEVCEQIR